MERRKYVYVVNASVEIDNEEHNRTLGVFNTKKKAEEAAHEEIFNRYNSDIEDGMMDEDEETLKPKSCKEGAWRYDDTFQGYHVSIWIEKLELGVLTIPLADV